MIHLIENRQYRPYNTIGQAIRHFREKKKLTQNELAKRIGCTQSNVCHYEQDRVQPTISKLKKIALELDVNVNLLINHKLHFTSPI